MVILSADSPYIQGNPVVQRDSVSDKGVPMCFQQAKQKVIDEFEVRYLTNLMQRSAGNVSQAARMAGKERRAFGKLLKKHGIEKILQETD